MTDDIDAEYYRNEAERCRWLAERADLEAAAALRKLAKGYGARAMELEAQEADQMSNEPQSRRA